VLWLSGPLDSQASCEIKNQLVKRRIIVAACEQVVPERVPELQRFAENYPKGFVASAASSARLEVAQVLDPYRGVVIRTQDGDRYLFQTADARACERFAKSTAFEVTLQFACCDGDPNPPCYLLPLYWLLRNPVGVK
jgi:hypothetical protein